MSDTNAFFKVKSSKRSNPEARTTLDAIHSQKIQSLLDDKSQVIEQKEELEKIRKKLIETASEMESWRLERQIDCLEKKIKSIESDSEINDYFLRSGDILFNYYDMQDKIHQGTAPMGVAAKAKPGSILAILEEVANEEGKKAAPVAYVPPESKKGRNELLNEYLKNEDPTMAKSDAIDLDDTWTECIACGDEMIMCMNEANLTCPSCGYQELILIDSDKPSYKDPPREVSYYAYKKINHFNEWLAQFQAKESTEIPQEIYDAILLQLKKERITDMSTLKPAKMREILRGMSRSKYYEHIPHIINRLNGQNAPFMSRENEEKLRHMFREIQPAFKKYCPKGRKNFLSYSYVLYKFCELLEMDEFLHCFARLKNRDKLYVQDKTWELICRSMHWQYIKTT
jgi:DNA-directed RNA polymerase subunit RPC12/RpoP